PRGRRRYARGCRRARPPAHRATGARRSTRPARWPESGSSAGRGRIPGAAVGSSGEMLAGAAAVTGASRDMPAYRPTPLLASAGMRTPLPAIQIEHLPYVARLQARDIADIDLVVIHCTELPDMTMAREYGERVLYPQAGTGAAGHWYV